MKRALAFCVFLFSPFAFGAPFAVGQKQLEFVDSARHRTLSTTVWYPAKRDMPMKPQPGNPLFLPVVAAPEAAWPDATQRFPLVMLSHGSGGQGVRLFWLGGYLASQGVIAVAFDHPGNSYGDTSGKGLMRVWERPKDISFALDRLLEDKNLAPHIDPSRIAAAGHSAGGTTVLMLAGGRFSRERFTSPLPSCGGAKDTYFQGQCRELKALDPKSFEKKEVEADYSDRRVKAVVAFDPGFARSFDPQTLRPPRVPVWAVLAETLAVPQDEIFSRDFLTLLPTGQADILPGSVHMTFLMPCTRDIPKSDPEVGTLCSGKDQKIAMQKNVSERALTFFKAAWK